MTLRTALSSLSAAGLAAALAYAPAATAGNVGFNLTVGAPGYAFSVGNQGYGFGYHAPAYGPRVHHIPYAPAYRPYESFYYAPVASTPYFVPAPVIVRPAPVVVRPLPVYRPYVGVRIGQAYHHAQHHHNR